MFYVALNEGNVPLGIVCRLFEPLPLLLVQSLDFPTKRSSSSFVFSFSPFVHSNGSHSTKSNRERVWILVLEPKVMSGSSESLTFFFFLIVGVLCLGLNRSR